MKIKYTHPLISCICITSGRSSHLLNSIVYFDRQNYPNRELIISYPTGDTSTYNLLKNISKVVNIRILLIERIPELSIGMAKNEAIKKCNGTYICIWDDDDWYSSLRISHQYNSLITKTALREASVLRRIILLHNKSKEAYLSSSYTWGGTLLCKKEIALIHPFLDCNRNDDTAIINYLQNTKRLLLIEDDPFIFIFKYHGNNLTPYYQYQYHIKTGELLDEETAKNIYNLANQNFEISQK